MLLGLFKYQADPFSKFPKEKHELNDKLLFELPDNFFLAISFLGKNLPADLFFYETFKEIDHIFFDEMVKGDLEGLFRLFLLKISAVKD